MVTASELAPVGVAWESYVACEDVMESAVLDSADNEDDMYLLTASTDLFTHESIKRTHGVVYLSVVLSEFTGSFYIVLSLLYSLAFFVLSNTYLHMKLRYPNYKIGLLPLDRSRVTLLIYATYKVLAALGVEKCVKINFEYPVPHPHVLTELGSTFWLCNVHHSPWGVLHCVSSIKRCIASPMGDPANLYPGAQLRTTFTPRYM
ncbi:hypothetical protein BDZ91DRAFT_762728 [Kalaharituber pfeilii]|nr:hypothetical protein BDZ91DRAFT_762728 [Kalaharituber pfeilii]